MTVPDVISINVFLAIRKGMIPANLCHFVWSWYFQQDPWHLFSYAT